MNSLWLKLGLVVGVFALLTAARMLGVDEVEKMISDVPKA